MSRAVKYFTFEKNYVQEYGRLLLLFTFLIYGFVFAFIFLWVDLIKGAYKLAKFEERSTYLKGKANNDISHYRVTSMRPVTCAPRDEKLELHQFYSNISQNSTS